MIFKNFQWGLNPPNQTPSVYAPGFFTAHAHELNWALLLNTFVPMAVFTARQLQPIMLWRVTGSTCCRSVQFSSFAVNKPLVWLRSYTDQKICKQMSLRTSSSFMSKHFSGRVKQSVDVSMSVSLCVLTTSEWNYLRPDYVAWLFTLILYISKIVFKKNLPNKVLWLLFWY